MTIFNIQLSRVVVRRYQPDTIRIRIAIGKLENMPTGYIVWSMGC